MLKVEQLHKTYKKIPAVDGISFTVNKGEIVGILGPNGAGKSTTIKCICGLIRQGGGQITIDGLQHKSPKARALMGYVPEVPEIYELLTVWEHLTFVAKLYRLNQWESRAKAYVERFELTDKLNELGQELSKGMKQKLSIIMALLIEPKVLLFDEPMIGLDPMAIRETKRIMREMADEGCAVLVSTHLLDTIEALCDDVLVLKNGKIIAQGSPTELKIQMGTEDATLEEVFLQVTKDA